MIRIRVVIKGIVVYTSIRDYSTTFGTRSVIDAIKVALDTMQRDGLIGITQYYATVKDYVQVDLA